jgi:GDP-L-fucose synthase
MHLRKLLITGATGFVGHHLRQELARRDVRFAAFSSAECDLTRRDETDALFRRHADADAIIHLAGLQAAADFPAKHTADQLDTNGLIHLNVLHAWHAHLPHAKLIAVGSSCAYPAQEGAICEDSLMQGPIHGSVWAYGFTKRLLYTGIRAYSAQHGLDGSFLIPATMFGEHDDFRVETAHFVGALIGKFVGAVIENRPAVEIWGDGSQVRDIMDVKEFAAAMLDLLPKCSRDTVNVGPGVGVSIRELAHTIAEAAGFRGELQFKPTAYVGVQTKTIDVSKLNNAYGIRINPDVTAAIRRTVAWYREHYPLLKDKRKFDPG